MILSYDRNIVPQETGYWCGPASTQVVLNGRGIRVREVDMARRMGTDEDGTDYVGLITPVLNSFVGGGYKAVSGSRDLWRDVKASIDAGFGVVANIVAPPSDYPRGVNGSKSPSYAGGTVYHYIALMGYDEPSRAVWVADSGFRPFGYWISVDQLRRLVASKGYTFYSGGVRVPDATVTSFNDVETQLWTWPQLGGRSFADALSVVLDGLT